MDTLPHVYRNIQLRIPRLMALPSMRILASVMIGLSALGSHAAGASKEFATVCALKETEVIILIEDHAEARDISSDRLAEAGLAMLEARTTCYEGRISDALVIYDSVLNLGPVARLPKR